MNTFRVNLIARVVGLTATLAVLVISYTVSAQLFLPVAVALIAIYQTIALIRYVERTNREVKAFLESIRYADFSQTFRFAALGGSFRDLSDEFSGVLQKVFIPFFSTKKDGSGIGLSLSQQIIRALGGSISVSSKANQETVFTIRL